MCFFVSLYRQYSISYLDAVVDATSVVFLLMIHNCVVDKSIESMVDRISHYVFASHLMIFWQSIFHHTNASKHIIHAVEVGHEGVVHFKYAQAVHKLDSILEKS